MIELTARPRWSSRFLPVALAALTCVALASQACGGNVVVVGRSTATSGSGGGTGIGTASGGAGGSVGTSNGGAWAGGGGGASCTVDPVPPQAVMQGCVTGNVCPAANTPEAKALVLKALGLCNLDVSPCCSSEVLDTIICGPSPSDGDCCYIALTTLHSCG